MGQETGSGLGWQGWLWMAILSGCLAALALGLGFRYGSQATEGSAGPSSSGDVESTVDVPQTINLFPASTRPRAEPRALLPPTSTTSVVSPPTTVLGLFTERPSANSPSAVSTTTSRPSTLASTTTSRPSTVTTSRPSTLASTTTSRPTTVPVTAAALDAVRPPPTATPSTATPSTVSPSTVSPSTRPATSTSEPTTTRWPGPVAVDDHLTVEEGKETKPKVLDNDLPGDSPLDEDTLTITAGPTNAEKYKVHNDHLHYKGAEGFVGIDRIRYRICDDAGRCDTATVTIIVG